MLKLKSGGFSCPVGGMAVLVSSPTLKSYGRACPSGTCAHRSTVAKCWGRVCWRDWALCCCSSVKAALPECKGPVPMAQLGHALKARSKSCVSLVGHCHLHIQWWLEFVPVLPALGLVVLPWWCQNTGTMIPQPFLLFCDFQEANVKNCLHMLCHYSRGLLQLLGWNSYILNRKLTL